MGKNPWMKFYPADWQSDQQLGVCSLAARGLWIECMAIMHRAQPYGHLLVNGQSPTDTQLGFLVRALPDQIPELLRELESAGVFSRNRAGVIYSRRMTRDEKKAQTSRKNGLIGGNPSLCNERQNSAWDNPKDKGVVKAQIPDTRYQNKDNISFEELWAICPRRIGKGQARKAYASALKKTSHPKIMDGMRRYAEAVKDADPKFIAHPATWLNGERWDDETVTERGGPKF